MYPDIWLINRMSCWLTCSQLINQLLSSKVKMREVSYDHKEIMTHTYPIIMLFYTIYCATARRMCSYNQHATGIYAEILKGWWSYIYILWIHSGTLSIHIINMNIGGYSPPEPAPLLLLTPAAVYIKLESNVSTSWLWLIPLYIIWMHYILIIKY